MTFGEALLDRSLAPSVEDFLRARRDSDAGYVRDGLRWLHAPSGPLAPGPRNALSIARTLASAAWADMSLAFSLWCHRMVIEYVRAAQEDSSGEVQGEIDAWLLRLERADVAGSSGLAAAMAHHVSGAPLPVKASPSGDQLALEGQLRWASNLFDDGFLLVTAADAGAAGKVIVAVPAGRTGLAIEPYPDLLDLQATASSSVKLTAAFVEAAEIVTTDFDRFIRRVRPTFLLFQASFCWGLAARALFEGGRLVQRPPNEVFASELHALETERDRVEAAITASLGDKKGRPASPSYVADMREIVGLRLSAARLAGAATRLECKLTGGAGYAARSATARRLREAAFLPIQSPTEGQLLWELSRSA